MAARLRLASHVPLPNLTGIKAVPVAFSTASIGRDSGNTFPELSSNFKAAHVKVVISFMAHLSLQMPPTPRCKLIAVMFWGLAEFLHTLDRAGRWMLDSEVARATRGGYAFLDTYLWLSTLSLSRALYKVTPKFHYLTHHIDDLRSGANPRFQHVFLDEDFMGKLRRLGSKCHRRLAPLRMLQRWSLFMANRWQIRKRHGHLRLRAQ
jgi:hypothetical protein